MKNQSRIGSATIAAVALFLVLSLPLISTWAGSPDNSYGTNPNKQEPVVPASDYAPHQLVVRSSQPTSTLAYLGRADVQSVTRVMSDAPVYLVQLDPSADVPTVAAQVAATPSVVYAHPNYLLSRSYSIQGSYPFPDQNVTGTMEGQYSNALLNLNEAHAIATGSGITIGVIDCGIDFAHPKLQGKAVSAWDYVDADAVAFDEPDGKVSGHGTFVAGIIHLVAPDATIRSYRVMNQNGYGDGFSVAQAIERAVNDGCKIINLSLALTARHLAVRDAIDRAASLGVTVVAGSGNDGQELAVYPAAEPNAVAVGSVDSLLRVTLFSNFGAATDLFAPGQNVYSSYLSSGYAWWSGTSFSAPFVSGVAALLKQQEPAASTLRIRQRMFNRATPIDTMNPNMHGGLGRGMVNPVGSLNDTTSTDSAVFIPDTLFATHHIGNMYVIQPFVSGLLISTKDPAPFTSSVVDTGVGIFCWVNDTANYSGDSLRIWMSPEQFFPGVYYNTIAFYVAGIPEPAYVVVCLTVEGQLPNQNNAWLTPPDVYVTAQHSHMSPINAGSYLSSNNAPALYTVSQRPGVPHVVQIIDTAGLTNDSVRFYFTPSEFFSPGLYEDTLFYSIAGILNPVALAIHIQITGDTVAYQSASFSPANPDYYVAPGGTYTRTILINSNPAATYSAYVPDSVPWLHLVHAGGTAPDSIVLQLVTTGLAPGPYMTYLYANVTGYAANPIIARIRMYVDTTSGTDSAWLTYSTAQFTAPGGVPTVTSGQFTVNAGGAAKQCAAFLRDARDFIRMQDSIKTTPGVFHFAIEPTTSNPGIYVDTVEIYINGVSNSPLRYVATLNIGASGATAWFHGADGDTVFSQASGTVSMRNLMVGSSNYPAAFTASFDGAVPFLSITSAPGVTPGTITYRVDTRSVTPGQYSSRLRVIVAGVNDTLSTSIKVNVTAGSSDSAWISASSGQFSAPGGVPTQTQGQFTVYVPDSQKYVVASLRDHRDFIHLYDTLKLTPATFSFGIEPTTTAPGIYVDTIDLFVLNNSLTQLRYVATLTIDTAGDTTGTPTVTITPSPLNVTAPPVSFDTLWRQVLVSTTGGNHYYSMGVDGNGSRFVYIWDTAGITNDSATLLIVPGARSAGVYTNYVRFYVVGVAGYTTLTVTLTVSEGGSEVASVELSNYPNPFNPTTTIAFTLPAAVRAKVEVYDLLGRNVNTLFDQVGVAGENLVIWDGTDRYGSPVASGIYFYRLTTESQSISKKMLLLK